MDHTPVSPLSLLIVEDEEMVRTMLARGFSCFGYKTEQAATIGQALGRLAERGQGFSLIIIDVILPDGNGCTLARAIRTFWKQDHTRIVLISGGCKPDRLPGDSHFIAKPFMIAQILSAIAQKA